MLMWILYEINVALIVNIVLIAALLQFSCEGLDIIGRLHVSENEAVKSQIAFLRPDADISNLDSHAVNQPHGVQSNRSVNAQPVQTDSLGNMSRGEIGVRSHSQQLGLNHGLPRYRPVVLSHQSSQNSGIGGHGFRATGVFPY